MGRDTVQLETVVSTISQEYLLEFTSEYGISEALHPKLRDPGERIVDFPEGKVKTGTRPRAAHEVPLLTVTASRVIEMEDPAAATDSSGVPSTIERSPLDFANENPSQQSIGPEDQGKEAVAPEVPPLENVTTTGVAPKAGQAKGIAATSVCSPSAGYREEKLKAAFEEFKQYEDNRVEQRCAEMDARLDALSIDFDEELYTHMLTTIAGRRWVIGHGLRLAVMKCGESTEPRQVFADVVSAGIAKGMSEGLKYGVEHGKANLSFEAIEAYDPEAEANIHCGPSCFKGSESDTRDDATQWIRELRPSSSQLKIPVYPEARDPIDPWACKEEILLADAIVANISCVEKKKKCRVSLHW
nr:hypothetical protein [Tanacetum cinerariifolium]